MSHIPNFRSLFLLIPLAVLVMLLGCKKPYSEINPDYKLGDLVPKEFDPPPLEEIESKVEWVDQPVVDSLELLRQYQGNQPEPELSVEEALAMENTSPEINEKMRAAMGRMPKSTDEIDYDAEIVRHIGGDVKSTNPLLISSTAEFDIQGLIATGLFGFDWEFNNFAAAATVKSWQSSKDGMYDKVVMRDDIFWSDGKPITAHDVEFSYKVIMTKSVPIPALRSQTEELLGVKAYDDRTVIFFHKEPLVTNTSNCNFSIIPKHVYEPTLPYDPTMEKSPAHVDLDRKPVTGGMYTVKSRQPSQEIVLERRESYYLTDGKQVRDKPHFKTIRFKVLPASSTALQILKKGDLDEMQLTPEQWISQTDTSDFYDVNTKVYDTEWVYFYFGWNCETPYFNDKRVRWAMSYAFDHEEMIEKNRHGLDEQSSGIFHPTSRWAPQPAPEPLTQDLKKAQELLAEAGWTDSDNDGTLDKEIDGKRIPFEFTMLVSSRPERIAVCSLLRSDLNRIGVKCNVRSLEFATLQERMRKHQFQAVMAGWGTGTDPDTANNIWTTNAIDNGRNYGKYTNPKIDDLFEQGKREFDPAKREEIYREIHMTLWEDQPYTWLFFQNAFFAFNKDLRGYNFSPRGPYNYGPGFDSVFIPAD